MRKTTAALLATATLLATAGCATGGHPANAGASATSRPPATSTAPTSTAPTSAEFSSSAVDPAIDTCQLVDIAATDQIFATAQAIAKPPGPALRTGVATSYATFAQTLSGMILPAPGKLAVALSDWMKASDDIAQFVATTTPPPGIVFDIGPAKPRWDAAQKAAEQICGHPLPNTP